MTSLHHVAVVGGGILGVSTAAHLARAGVHVTLVTEGALADGASGRSIAWLNSSGDRSAAYHYLRIAGIDRYRSWRAHHPGSEAYLRFDGALKWAGPGESFRETFDFERRNGYDAVWVDRADIASVAPDVDPEAVAAEGAIFNPGEGWVNMPDLIAALVTDAVAAGAEVRENVGPARVDVQDGVATGVVLADGSRIEADHVVLATGPAVPADLAALGVTIPDATPAAFVLFTDPVDVPVQTVLNTPRVAVRPTPDGRLVLDADWAEQSVQVADDGSLTVPDESVAGLLEEASRVLAGHPQLTASRVGAGLKPIPGDGDPAVGEVPGIQNLSALFTHSGATLGLILGELVAEEIVTGAPSPLLDDFRFARFVGVQAPEPVATGAWTPVADD
ncbi:MULTISPECIES: FAD-binding oxidoreductase [Microbacterium]|uniref:NAD(P)/FAD-dependent oxidoreductase n=1 Tax=Microbacterium TaxID=33882 RepID=UPI002786AED4|nr:MULTISPECIES: FAD-binding oxidoreductase [Microbacterium]MDQ1082239.1 glycine/D-amino acid oxidase-like deaminating enzyme [Microbacterium sp. SORGH_AS_0344]MDQ1168990.1 glycine/D-amino acid oxidase-like deaminating enzyme [Microbacterium proteolyticum]